MLKEWLLILFASGWLISILLLILLYDNKIKGIYLQNNNKEVLVATPETLEHKRRMFKHKDIQPVLAIMQYDNLLEVFKTMEEENKPYILGTLERNLSEWANSLDGYLSRTGEGNYLLFLTEWGYKQAEKTRFSILDKTREIEMGNDLPITISLGIGIREDNINELGRLAQSALDIALDRGGDQVVVKTPTNIKFYGGKSISIERRTKIKARATADALKNMIFKASQVIVMGHEMADFDSLGASFGIAKAANDLGKKVFIVIDDYNQATDHILAIYPQKTYPGMLVRARDVESKVVKKTLLIIVDTHKPSLLPNQRILSLVSQIVIIDHHRRGEEFIGDARLVYLETYASSTSELVTELLQYLGEQVEIGKAEATALLAGITVDTKHFMIQTGVRTFEAASYLRSMGADPAVVHKMLNDDIYTVVKKAEVLRNVRILYGKIALGVYREKSHDAQLMAAKTADAMLNIASISASFVIWPHHEGVAVSARSNGEINVQTIMEELGGGGHLNVAAAKLEESLEEVEKRLLLQIEAQFHT
ncbi:MAG: recombinase RecJ [Firmicutes bacterium HGW-Firmicutes-12]|nr:MAG: recombinase RecJ [Firmicutes bacterium HGW-Firmicutes-12]